ncbi:MULTISPECIES: hypothetical protein [unclassified Chitinophaga]|uniref:hypothetical protein n=1 Tax=unclassified Chitinophaga TaxID=2619133 RepID=UPI0015C31763|nr:MULTISPECIES: hypothetical protein [unclassified Chitinophaga]WPV70541.1 hypothetical protein QQL36_17675 [Chitinophaga sp. LS1]
MKKGDFQIMPVDSDTLHTEAFIGPAKERFFLQMWFNIRKESRWAIGEQTT